MKILVVLLVFLVGCETVKKQPQTEVKQPIKEVSLSWEKGHPERKAWSQKLTDEIATNMGKFSQAKDIAKWCPKYSLLNDEMKVYVWAELFVRVALKESSFNPKTAFKEPAPLNVYSLGLYQLSYEDRMSHCVMDKAKQTLFDPLENIKCAVGQAAKLVAKDSILTAYPPPKGMARYWSVMRETKSDGSKRPSYAEIKAHVEGLSVCK